jgi:outer membrane protein assembly factor BamB
MKKILLTLCFFASIACFGQYKTSRETVGRILETGEPIEAKVFSFDYYVYDCSWDTTHHKLMVELRGVRKNKYWKNDGRVMAINTDSKEPIWHKPVNYQKEIYYMVGENMFVVDAKSNTCLYHQTGTKKWSNTVPLFFADHDKGIGLGYEGSGNDMHCINLESGETKWKRPVMREFGWEEIGYLNDSTMYMIANGIHTFDLRTGKGWDVNLQSGDESYAAASAITAGSVALGVLTGFIAIPDIGPTITHGMISNTLIDSTSIYIAARKRIVRADRTTGKLIWNHPFEKDCGSSTLLMDDSLVYMIHNASAQKEKKDIVVGKPFFAAYDRNTGEERYHTELTSRTSVLDYMFLHDTLFVLCQDRIFTCLLENGEVLGKTDYPSKDFPSKTYGKPLYFANNRFMKDDPERVYFPLIYSDKEAVFLFTDNGSLLRINTKLEITPAIEAMQFKYLRNACGPFLLIEDGGKTVLYDDNTKFAEIDYTNLSIVGTTAFKRLQDKIIFIDLQPIIDSMPKPEPDVSEPAEPELDSIIERNEVPIMEPDSIH